jgi:hypothetical protein
MKTLILFLCCLSASLWSQEVTLENIGTFEGKIVTFCAPITGTYQTKGERKVTYLNFGKAYPDHSFTVVFFEKVLKTFSYDPLTLKGKQVCITGKVILYKEKPEIVLYDEKDLKVED